MPPSPGAHSFVITLAAMPARRAVAPGGALMLVRRRVVCFNHMILFNRGSSLSDDSGRSGTIASFQPHCSGYLVKGMSKCCNQEIIPGNISLTLPISSATAKGLGKI